MPAWLKVYTNRRIFVVTLFAFSSGLPFPMVTGTLDVWMKSLNVDLTTIGIFSLVQLPYAFKFLWAPLMDRFRLPFLHHRTGWTLLCQILIVVGLVIMGMSDPVGHPWQVAFLAFMIAFFGASQDISLDAYRTELLKPTELAAGAATATVWGRIAYLISGAVAIGLSEDYGWQFVYFMIAGFMAVGILGSLIGPAPLTETRRPGNLHEAVIEPFSDLLKLHWVMKLLLFVVLFKMGDVVAGKMTSPFLMDIGFGRKELAAVNKTFGMLVSIGAALVGGGLYAKWGLWKSLWIFGILQAVSNFVFVIQAYVGLNSTMLWATIGIENLCGSLGTVAFTAFLMSVCTVGHAGTQYALLTSLMALTRTLGSAPTGFMAERLGWPGFFTVSAGLAIPGLILLWLMRKDIVDKPIKAS